MALGSKIKPRKLNTLDDLYGWVRRQLGWPIVKVELTDDQIHDCIISALDLYLKYADGQATEDAYYLLQLEGGKSEYELSDRHPRHPRIQRLWIWREWDKHPIYDTESNV